MTSALEQPGVTPVFASDGAENLPESVSDSSSDTSKVWTAGTDSEQEYAELWRIAALAAEHGRLRSVQTSGGLLGASDFGQCPQKAVYTIRQTPPTDVPSKGRAMIGSALHEVFLPHMKALQPQLLVEPELTATLPSGRQITCHPDLLDPDEPSVTDAKFVADLAYKRKEGVTEQQQMQRHLYGLAMIQAGLADPDRLIVRNVFVSMTDAQDVWVQQQPFDMAWIDAADEWAAQVAYAVEHDEDAARDAQPFFCASFCPWVSDCRPTPVDAQGELTSPGLRERVRIAAQAREQRLKWEKVEKQAQEALKGVSGRAGDVTVVSTTVNSQRGPYERLTYKVAQ